MMEDQEEMIRLLLLDIITAQIEREEDQKSIKKTLLEYYMQMPMLVITTYTKAKKIQKRLLKKYVAGHMSDGSFMT